MPEQNEKAVKEFFGERDQIVIENVSVAKFESDDIKLIPYHRSDRYAVFLPNYVASMEMNSMIAKISTMKIHIVRA